MPTADELIGPEVVTALAVAVERALPGTACTAVRAARRRIAPLALRQRAVLLADALVQDVPGGYAPLAAAARAALADPGFTGWMTWPVTEAAVALALADGGTAAFDDALALLAELTPRLSGEFAIRGLLAADLDRAVATIVGWTESPDEHVRRLATEGTRPFLPWSKRVPAILARPSTTVPILDALHRDESEYVRRSVANHLNDLNRQQPDLAVELAERWLAAPEAGVETQRLVRHGLRTLVKQGHPGALALLGFPPADAVTVTAPVLGAATVAVGGELPFEATLVNTGDAPARLAVDYVVHHVKANGGRTPKVFKLATRVLAPGESVTVSRRHPFKPISTRRYHPGEHAIALQVNGIATAATPFHLTVEPG
ncbi:hypothetical protein KSP35_11780 [Aquihabitans sp. G128]|uniref:hypothetical protein n=1 Tax=Aquihabitans sp. G128 TaxID=2849779 RepID=UPI001C248171|nr:hypothetical protein [Aquihabitans sp. G128]QXC59094.1 hypothetical protein KSP35_11780 [Aquihabitans sp. G128]